MLPDKVTYPDFQPLIYLLVAKELYDIDSFRLFYIFDNDSESSKDDYDIRRSSREVRLVRGDVFDALASDESIFNLEEILSKDYKQFARQLVELVSTQAPDDIGQWGDDEGLKSRAVEVIGKNVNKTNLKNAQGAVNKLADCIKGGFVITDRSVLVPSETLDSFAEFVDSEYERMRSMSVTEFPAMPRIDCKDCNFKALCTREKATVIEFSEVE
jgi:hypothetical protein